MAEVPPASSVVGAFRTDLRGRSSPTPPSATGSACMRGSSRTSPRPRRRWLPSIDALHATPTSAPSPKKRRACGGLFFTLRSPSRNGARPQAQAEAAAHDGRWRPEERRDKEKIAVSNIRGSEAFNPLGPHLC
uniref:Uncharacterized protein n=1 Tax=Oryza brachyantha TaxID=4533 RepID=J3KYH0_ORYBR